MNLSYNVHVQGGFLRVLPEIKIAGSPKRVSDRIYLFFTEASRNFVLDFFNNKVVKQFEIPNAHILNCTLYRKYLYWFNLKGSSCQIRIASKVPSLTNIFKYS
jgi:hypothetical protein